MSLKIKSADFNPKIVTTGLVGFWDAGNPRSYPGSGNTWIDLSGSGYNGTLFSTSYSNTNGGQIVYNTSSINSTTLIIPGTTWSMSVWFNLTNSTNWWQGIIGVYQTNIMGLVVTNATNVMGLWSETSSGGALGSGVISANTWYNYTLTREGNSVAGGYKLYVNGNFTGSVNTGTRTSSDYVYLGSRPDAGQSMTGGISNASVYNRALTPQEVRQNFNALRGRFGL